jgi:energy-coupling factor transporter ATP-binding protein EcfA2
MNDNLSILQTKGKELFGEHFQIIPEDYEVVHKLLTWFLQDEKQARQFGINLNKGILLSGPVGCGKTSLTTLIRVLIPPQQRFGIKSCREIAFDFIKDGYEIIQRYSTHAYTNTVTPPKPHTHCFDDLGAESTLKYYGNQCNVMGEILFSAKRISEKSKSSQNQVFASFFIVYRIIEELLIALHFCIERV